jgi:Cu-Zn family superoxide dismutase
VPPPQGSQASPNAEQVAPGVDDPDTLGTTQTPAAAPGLDHGKPSAPPAASTELEAEGDFQAAPGVKLEGEAELAQRQDGVRVEVEVKNAPPGVKGIHIHERGDCSDIPGKSMGEHFAPGHKDHGLPHAAVHHLGDLGNIQVDRDGNGKLEIVVPRANLKLGDPHSFVGKSVVIHEKRDVGTGPSGESGKPIACAVIKQS